MWQPISRRDFDLLYQKQESALPAEAREVLDRFRVPTYTAIIRRSNAAGDEPVFVVAESPRGVIYFDDVEYGFNISPLDGSGHVTRPGGSQMGLADAVVAWLAPQHGKRV